MGKEKRKRIWRQFMNAMTSIKNNKQSRSTNRSYKISMRAKRKPKNLLVSAVFDDEDLERLRIKEKEQR